MAQIETNQIEMATAGNSSNNLLENEIKSSQVKEFMAELLGTFILLLMGLSGVAQYRFFSKDDPNSTSLLSINIEYAFASIIAILVVGKVSGAHINPAVSFAMLLTGRMTYLRFFIYLLAQLIGAFLGAVMTFVIYIDTLKTYKENMYSLETAEIFSTYPNKNLSVFGGFLDQVVGTGLLILVVLALADKKNFEIANGTTAILVGFTVIAIGCTLGYNCGYAINPARDIGPRIFTSIAGWGSKVFTAGNYFFWIPIVGPMTGSLVATIIYSIFVSNNL